MELLFADFLVIRELTARYVFAVGTNKFVLIPVNGPSTVFRTREACMRPTIVALDPNALLTHGVTAVIT